MTRINQSMGLPYKDQGIKFKGNSKQQIVKAVWATYGVELVKHYKPRHLVILGKGVHEAIGQDELESVMQGMGGKYLGYIKHPSWNGHYGYNIMPLLCKLQQMASPPPEVAYAADQVTSPAATDVHKLRQMKLPPPEVAMAAAEVNLTAVTDVDKLQQMALPPPEVARAAEVNSPAATNVDKKDFYKNLNMDYLNVNEEDNVSMSFSLDGFSIEENQDEQIMKVLDEWMNDLV